MNNNQNKTTVKRIFQSSTLIASALALTLAGFTSASSANRPAMEESSRPAAMAPSGKPASQSAKQSTSGEPEENLPTAPSAVELMMQQQSHQTGDVLNLPAQEVQPGETIRINVLDSPRRGMSMKKVQYTMGQPLSVSEAVGQPPITTWTYADRIVYFEYSSVIHVVAR